MSLWLCCGYVLCECRSCCVVDCSRGARGWISSSRSADTSCSTRSPLCFSSVLFLIVWCCWLQGLTFATVRDAGHMVPWVQPQRSFNLFQCVVCCLFATCADPSWLCLFAGASCKTSLCKHTTITQTIRFKVRPSLPFAPSSSLRSCRSFERSLTSVLTE